MSVQSHDVVSGERRYEVKMVVDALLLDEVRSWTLAHPAAFRAAYPLRRVNNLYFDTFERQFILDHVDGLAERAKVRYRWYGETWRASAGQVEIKHKQTQLSRKIIFPVDASLEIAQLSWEEIIAGIVEHTAEDCARLLNNLEPVLINYYWREYYVNAEGDIRLTLDYGMRAFDQAFGFFPNIRFPQPLLNELVIEVKAPSQAHGRVADVLAEFPLRCIDNSKYLNGLATAIW